MTAEPTEYLDVRGIPCPKNYSRILIRMEVMGPGDIVEILLDDGEPFANVTTAIRDEGHAIVLEEKHDPHWRLLVRRC